MHFKQEKGEPVRKLATRINFFFSLSIFFSGEIVLSRGGPDGSGKNANRQGFPLMGALITVAAISLSLSLSLFFSC